MTFGSFLLLVIDEQVTRSCKYSSQRSVRDLWHDWARLASRWLLVEENTPTRQDAPLISQLGSGTLSNWQPTHLGHESMFVGSISQTSANSLDMPCRLSRLYTFAKACRQSSWVTLALPGSLASEYGKDPWSDGYDSGILDCWCLLFLVPSFMGQSAALEVHAMGWV